MRTTTRPTRPARPAWPMPDPTDWPVLDLEGMTAAWSDLAGDLADAYGSFLGIATPDRVTGRPGSGTRPHESTDHHGHGPGRCRSCGTTCRGSCHCTCCVSDADLVVRARLGERRVVPIRIHNERQRPRQVVLELSDFTTSGGHEVPVTGRIATAAQFELAACSDHDTILVLESELPDGSPDDSTGSDRTPRDVDDCTVAYADLRIQGCDVRPMRIAVLLLPRDCDAHEVHCACGCC